MDDHYVQLWLVSNFVENNTFTIALARRSSKNVLLAALISIHNTSIEGGKQMQGVESRQERRAALGQFKSLPTSCERRRRQRITVLLLLDAGTKERRPANSPLISGNPCLRFASRANVVLPRGAADAVWLRLACMESDCADRRPLARSLVPCPAESTSKPARLLQLAQLERIAATICYTLGQSRERQVTNPGRFGQPIVETMAVSIAERGLVDGLDQWVVREL